VKLGGVPRVLREGEGFDAPNRKSGEKRIDALVRRGCRSTCRYSPGDGRRRRMTLESGTHEHEVTTRSRKTGSYAVLGRSLAHASVSEWSQPRDPPPTHFRRRYPLALALCFARAALRQGAHMLSIASTMRQSWRLVVVSEPFRRGPPLLVPPAGEWQGDGVAVRSSPSAF